MWTKSTKPSSGSKLGPRGLKFCLLFLAFCLPSLSWAQQSPEPPASNPFLDGLPQLPEQPSSTINPPMPQKSDKPLSLQLADRLESWDKFWTMDVRPLIQDWQTYGTEVQTWYQKVTASWNLMLTSLRERDEKAAKELAAKDAEIEYLRSENIRLNIANAGLKSDLNRARGGMVITGITGLGVGFILKMLIK